MAQQMLEVNSLDLEFITPEMKGLLENLGLNQQENQLDQNFCLGDNGISKEISKEENKHC